MLLSGCSYEHPGPMVPADLEAASTPVVKPQTPAARSVPFPTRNNDAVNESTRVGGPSGATSATINPSSPGDTLPGKPLPPSATTSGSGPDPSAGLFPEIGLPATQPTTAPPPASTPAPESDQPPSLGSGFDNLEIVDESLKAKIDVLRVGSQPTTNNLLSVFAGLKNKTGRTLNLEIQTVYKDKEGNPLNDGSWIPVTLKPHAETEYHSASISPDAADFLVRVRSAQSEPL